MPLDEPQPLAVPTTPRLGVRARGASLAGVVVPPLVVFGLVLGVWFLVSYVVLEPDRRFLLPGPDQVVKIGFLDGANRAEILDGLWLTTRAFLVGFVLAVLIGTVLAVAMSQAKWIERSLFPYAVVLQTIPILAIVPVIGFALGFDFSSRVLVCVLIALFPIITNTLFGLTSAERAQHDLFTLHRAGRWTRLVKLQFPAALPAIFTGLRTSAGLAVVGAVVGDFFFKQGDPGIGVLIDLYSSQLESERLYASVIAASLLGVVVFVGMGVLERRVVGRWHIPTRGT